MKILSLFDGISCARVALERAGIHVEAYYASEVDKYAIQIAQKNYPNTVQLGSVVDICRYEDMYDWGGIDLLIGGSPCQDLSIAKKDRKGLDGERSGLFWEYVRILNEVKPKYFILENVNSMPKEAKQLITETLGVEPIMINAALVSAQNRKRLFWVGAYVEDIGYLRVNVQQPEDMGILLKDILEENVDEKYLVRTTQEMLDRGNRYPKGGQAGIIYTTEGKSATISCAGRGCADNSGLYRIGQIGKGGQGDRIYSPEGKSVGLSALGGGRGAKTGLYAVAQRGRHIITSVFKDSMVMENSIIRKLTPIECERLQCLPDNYTEGVSNSQRYKMLGNAFNVDVVAHILSFIPHLKGIN